MVMYQNNPSDVKNLKVISYLQISITDPTNSFSFF